MFEKKEIQISVIIPVYNVKNYIEMSLKCLIKQTFRDFEIICIDDCSSDGTEQILKQYEDKTDYIHVYKNAVNMGAAESRNKGLQYAKGRYVIFLDGDDIFHEQLLEKLYDSCERDHSEAAFCMFQAFDEEHHVRSIDLYPMDVEERIDNSNRNVLFQYLCFSPCNKLVLKELLLKENISFQDLPNANDVYYSLMVITLVKQVSLVKEELIFYRENRSGNLSAHRKKGKTYFIYALAKYLRTVNERKLLTNENRRYILGAMISQVYSLYINCEEEKREQIRAVFVENMAPIYNEIYRTDLLELTRWEWYQFDFLCGKVKEEKNRYQIYINEIEEYLKAQKNKKISIWGAGKLGTQLLQTLEKCEPKVECVIDNDETKWGRYLYGCEVVGFDKIKNEVDEIWVLNSKFFPSIKKQVQNRCKVVDFAGLLKN